jgi:hypothetical protein
MPVTGFLILDDPSDEKKMIALIWVKDEDESLDRINLFWFYRLPH